MWKFSVDNLEFTPYSSIIIIIIIIRTWCNAPNNGLTLTPLNEFKKVDCQVELKQNGR
jgi:hypothetical protein